MSKRKRSGYSSKRRSKRRRTSKKRSFKRYGKRRSGGRRNGAQRLSVKRSVFAGTITTNSTANVNNYWQYVQWNFTKSMSDFAASPSGLAGFPDMSRYEELYEQGKISAIRFKFMPKFRDLNTTQIVTGTQVLSYQVPQYVAICKDPKSTVTPSGVWGQGILNTLQEHGCKVYRADKPITVYMKGLVRDTVADGTVYKYIKPPSVDLNTSGKALNHRGFHMYLYNQGFDSTRFEINFDVYVTYYVTFRNAK